LIDIIFVKSLLLKVLYWNGKPPSVEWRNTP